MKKEPMMMRGMKYIQFHALPEASLLWKQTQTSDGVINAFLVASELHIIASKLTETSH